MGKVNEKNVKALSGNFELGPDNGFFIIIFFSYIFRSEGGEGGVTAEQVRRLNPTRRERGGLCVGW